MEISISTTFDDVDNDGLCMMTYNKGTGYIVITTITQGRAQTVQIDLSDFFQAVEKMQEL